MDKLKMQTPDKTQENIALITRLFPHILTETRDENDKPVKAIDFDLLKQTLSATPLADDDSERYRLDWPGKKASLLKANTPINKTLRPCKEESVNFDMTENLYIEGDNFEILKILQESYLNKVKMIYIDPPYNTGKDFIYSDKYAKSKEEYEAEIGLYDEEDGKLFKNTDSNGRFHSDWLSMMYERLMVARDLLRDDGVIFISIDDNEVHNLRKICDEVFGEENFVASISRITKKGGNKGFFIKPKKDHILFYFKNISLIQLDKFGEVRSFCEDQDWKEELYDGKLRKYKRGDIPYREKLDVRANQRYFIEAPDGSLLIPPGDSFPELNKDAEMIRPVSKNDKCWTWSRDRYLQEKINKRFVFIESHRSPFLNERKEKSKWTIYKKVFDFEEQDKIDILADFIDEFENSKGTKEMNDLGIPFDYPKPFGLIKHFLKRTGCNEGIILDFFSGSATTAHAVMQLNAEDGGKRKFIMVQLPEKTAEDSEAYKAGYKTIAEIGKERIRRAGKKIKEELAKKNNGSLDFDGSNVNPDDLDTGFRVFKVDSTNMKDVYYHPSETAQTTLEDLLDNIKEDRTAEDLLTQVLLNLGLELSLPVEERMIKNNKVYIVQTNALVACFDNELDFSIIDEIAKLQPFKVVFKDSSFKDDKDRINLEERFKRLAPNTEISVL